MEQNMFIRILNSEMELATGCTEPGAVALTAAEAGQALRKAGVDKAEEITVNASINIIKNAMSAGIPGTDYEGMDYAAAIGADEYAKDAKQAADIAKKVLDCADERLKTLWNDLKAYDERMYRRARYGVVGFFTNLRGRAGDKTTLGLYRLASKIFKFN